jgi:hypothetical protein
MRQALIPVGGLGECDSLAFNRPRTVAGCHRNGAGFSLAGKPCGQPQRPPLTGSHGDSAHELPGGPKVISIDPADD